LSALSPSFFCLKGQTNLSKNLSNLLPTIPNRLPEGPVSPKPPKTQVRLPLYAAGTYSSLKLELTLLTSTTLYNSVIAHSQTSEER